MCKCKMCQCKCKDIFMRFIVIGAIIVGFAFNLWVIGACDFLHSKNSLLQVGVFRYSLNLNTSPQFDTGGECVKYSGDVETDGYVLAAQVCAALAAFFGAMLLVLVPLQQFACNICCGGCFIGLSYAGAQICTALVWLLYKTPLCSIQGVSCDWGEAASGNFIAQMMYLIAAIFHRCMPSGRETAADRKAADAEKKEKDAEARADKAEAELAAAEANMTPDQLEAVTGV